MQQQRQERYPQYPDEAMVYDHDVKASACERKGAAVPPAELQPCSEPKFVWHCSEYDF